jgi:hypothetical protein
MKLRRNENALIGIELTDAEKLKIGSMGKEHAFGFHDSVSKIAGGDIVVLLSVETEETGTQVTNGVNVKHHFYHPPKNQKFQSNRFEAPRPSTGKNKLVKIEATNW